MDGPKYGALNPRKSYFAAANCSIFTAVKGRKPLVDNPGSAPDFFSSFRLCFEQRMSTRFQDSSTLFTCHQDKTNSTHRWHCGRDPLRTHNTVKPQCFKRVASQRSRIRTQLRNNF